jgi:hypothetical protein
MGFLNIFSSIASGIVKPVVGYFQNKQALAAQGQANQLKYLQAIGDRQAALVSQGLAADATWELESIKAGSQYRGFELYVVSVPLILCFTPWSYIVKAGFDAIANTPTWFQFTFMTIFLGNYGVRLWRRNTSDT